MILIVTGLFGLNWINFDEGKEKMILVKVLFQMSIVILRQHLYIIRLCMKAKCLKVAACTYVMCRYVQNDKVQN